ncbi:TIGR03936 family radical SAM-associated protein [Crossiella sp. CA-258035]|uniref:TIGR03936 family radical SAM-associated protein n=1 Tax=Crossiella sp. CA-258035 TaxID=2981138 RepID=UPI0024BCE142|nr:TIGR03936 family radical SAM-associated protein [Crossiella sp. CA-258035]WHT20830.1 TIGR03936 family radical SAM-associated protein [Crossiella sp. CA-258035]
MQKLRLRYAKRGRLRFTSHRDVARAFERALRRAGVPMAYSQGFSPHPKVSWIGAAPTGVASEAEYVEIQVVHRVDPEVLRAELDAALPPGLDVLEAVEAGPGTLPERIEASRWRIELAGVDPAELAKAAEELLARDVVEVERLTKDGRRMIDARAAVVDLRVDSEVETTTTHVGDGPQPGLRCGILTAVVRQTTPTVRPDDVLSALRVVADLVSPVPAKASRLAQGRLDDRGDLTDPLAPDREATPPVLDAPR